MSQNQGGYNWVTLGICPILLSAAVVWTACLLGGLTPPLSSIFFAVCGGWPISLVVCAIWFDCASQP